MHTKKTTEVFETIMQKSFREFLGSPVVKPSVNPKPMWNAHVSYNTYHKLNREGILS
jgi:hypothetical protein